MLQDNRTRKIYYRLFYRRMVEKEGMKVKSGDKILYIGGVSTTAIYICT